MQQPNPQINLVPARRGWQWLMQAGDIIGRRAGVFLLIGLLWTLVSYLQVIPLLGTLVLLILTPGLQAGVMYAVARAGGNQQPGGGDLFALLGSDRRGEMLQLGGLLLLCAFLALLVISVAVAILFRELLDIGLENLQTLEAWQNLDISLVKVWLLLVIVVALFALVGILFFFAIPRVAFDGRMPGAALGESFRACIHNWRAMLMFGLAQVVVFVAAGIMLMLLVIPAELIAGALLSDLIVNLGLMLVQVVICGGQYLAWQDVFERGSDQPEAAPQEQPDDHFIA